MSAPPPLTAHRTLSPPAQVLVPSEDEAISKQEVAGLRLRKKFTVQAISSINDAIQHALRLPGGVVAHGPLGQHRPMMS